MKHGLGTLTLPNRDVIETTFVNDRKHGKGSMHQASTNKKIEIVFFNDTFSNLSD